MAPLLHRAAITIDIIMAGNENCNVLLLVLIDELFDEDIMYTVQIIKIIPLMVSINKSAWRVPKKLTGDGFQTD